MFLNFSREHLKLSPLLIQFHNWVYNIFKTTTLLQMSSKKLLKAF